MCATARDEKRWPTPTTSNKCLGHPGDRQDRRQAGRRDCRIKTSELVAVGSRTQAAADAFAANYGGIRAHGSYDALLADDAVDAIYVSTPHPQHAEWTIKALEAGKAVLCEKPLGVNHPEAMAMVETAAFHRRFLMEAFMYRVHPQTAKVGAAGARRRHRRGAPDRRQPWLRRAVQSREPPAQQRAGRRRHHGRRLLSGLHGAADRRRRAGANRRLRRVGRDGRGSLGVGSARVPQRTDRPGIHRGVAAPRQHGAHLRFQGVDPPRGAVVRQSRVVSAALSPAIDPGRRAAPRQSPGRHLGVRAHPPRKARDRRRHGQTDLRPRGRCGRRRAPGRRGRVPAHDVEGQPRPSEDARRMAPQRRRGLRFRARRAADGARSRPPALRAPQRHRQGAHRRLGQARLQTRHGLRQPGDAETRYGDVRQLLRVRRQHPSTPRTSTAAGAWKRCWARG